MAKKSSGVTPEKQLLKLIEEPQLAGLKKETARRMRTGFFSFGALRGRALFFRERARGFLRPQKGPIGIKGINRILLFCTVILVIYLIVGVVNSIIALDEMSPLTEEFSRPRAEDGTTTEIISPLRKGPFYSERVKSRNIFQFVAPKVIPEAKKKGGAPAPKKKIKEIVELVKGMKLVGISWDPDDPVVFIEDANGITHFLKRGDVINKVKIAGIFPKKVILRYKQQEAEVTLTPR